ncbi:hypothetical protein EZV62_022607 [Acer yangbiense]|uniref:Uncharacterized protein n=1 Tax=Acer yangbiense TaxID=1000413 RepID=A0A5C7H8W2_9ROSI|nr:hypothetical protein EZV62_022607 [Acer yangbiense]
MYLIREKVTEKLSHLLADSPNNSAASLNSSQTENPQGGSYIFELDNYSDLNVCRGILDYKSICLFLEEEKDVYCFLANKISAFYCFFCFHEAITDAVLSVQIHPELGAFDQLEQNATNAKIPFYERYGMF